MLNSIVWNVDPNLFTIDRIPFYWYFLLILAAVLFVGFFLFSKKEKTDEKGENSKKNEKGEKKSDDTKELYIMVAALVVGALFIKFKYPDLSFIGPVTVRWYGLMWATAIFAALMVVKSTFKHDKCPEEWGDKLFLYGTVGLIVGARVGHCLFYGAHNDFFYYYRNPIEILYIWEGGLASHGGAFGLLIAMYLYNKNVIKKGYLWILDRLVIGVAIGGAFIRFGNLMNSEIYGGETTLPWGFIFTHAGENMAKHPTQIYEIIYCLLTFAVCMWLYWKTKAAQKEGLIFGVFLIGIFFTRFLLEFIKENQVGFEDGMIFNMGQLLSIPFFLVGFYLIFRKTKKI